MTMEFAELSDFRKTVQFERKKSESRVMLSSGDVVEAPVATTSAWKFTCSEVPSGKLIDKVRLL